MAGSRSLRAGAILDWLDEQVPPELALIPRSGEDRRHALHICALATGLADKAVSFIYSRLFHGQTSDAWDARCQTQIHDVLVVLERECGEYWWGGAAIGHADIAVACTLRFLGEAHPGLFDVATYPALAAHCGRCEAMKAFSSVVQPFSPPS